MADVEHHPLLKEFPGLRARIHALKVGNAEFHKLLEEYEQIDKEICRIETSIEPAAEIRTEILKKKRVFLKDLLFELLQHEP